MNYRNYRLLVAISKSDHAPFFTCTNPETLKSIQVLVSLNHVEGNFYMRGPDFNNRVVGYKITPAGLEAMDDYRRQRAERWWTRGLAIAAIIISLAALALELDDRGMPGGALSGFRSSQSAAQSSQS